MHNGSAIKVVCFDLGGVVVRICRTWDEGCAAAGLPVRDPEKRAATKDARRGLIAQFQTGRIDGAAFAHRISQSMDGLYSPDEILAVHHAWIRGEYDGIIGIVDELHSAGIATATLSNTNHEHWSQMVTAPAVQRIRHLLASHLLGLHKPEPEVFRAAESHLNARPHEILFFDDLQQNVDAARTCGWIAEPIDPRKETAPQIRRVLSKHRALRGDEANAGFE